MSKSFIWSASIWGADNKEELKFASRFTFDASVLGAFNVEVNHQEDGLVRLHAIFPDCINQQYKVAEYIWLTQDDTLPYYTYSIQFDTPDDVGYIYLMEAVGSPRVKIGYSEDPVRRNKQLSRCQAPYPIEIIHTAHCRQMSQAEAFLKRAFADKQVHGEWYELEQRDVEIVKSLRFI